MKNKVVLQTPHLTLRHLYPTDADALASLCQQPDALAWAQQSPIETTDQALRVLQHYDQYPYGLGRWGVEARGADATLCGWCGLHFNLGEGHVDLAFAFEPAAWHNGWAAEAMYACLTFGFEKMRLFEIVCTLPAQHTQAIDQLRSLGLLPKLDFQETPPGTLTFALQRFQFIRKPEPVVSIF